MSSGIRTRDYQTVELAITLIQHAVEYGFDTRSDDAYELFASEGMLGDPDDLTWYEWIHARSQILNLAKDAIEHLANYHEE